MVLTALLAITFASALAAQERSEGRSVGGGFGQVRSATESGTGPQLNGRVGVQLSRQLMAVVEVGVFGPENEVPRVGDVVVDERGVSTIVRRRTRLLRTPVLLLGVQAGGGDGLYVRGAVGVGSHSYAAYGPWPEMNTASTSSEVGPAAGLSAGYSVRIGARLHMGIEAVVIRSGGEDSSGARTILGLQIVPVLRL
jgi:hypothetical protein